MAEERRKIGRDGKAYIETVVGTFNIPSTFRGKYLRLDGKTGEVVSLVAVKKTQAEKEAKKKSMLEEQKKKWATLIKINKDLVAEIKSLSKDITELKKEGIKLFKSGKSVDSLNDRIAIKQSRILELRSKKKHIPKKYK